MSEEFNYDFVMRWIKDHWTNPKHCPLCGFSDWEVAPKLWYTPEFIPKSPLHPTAALPFVAIECKNCGHTIFLNAIRMGLIEKDQ